MTYIIFMDDMALCAAVTNQYPLERNVRNERGGERGRERGGERDRERQRDREI